ncbi:MAG: universal stress protein [Aquificae bacterium]|nr:universal stress protein [Aquificota bacterium]
MKALLVLVDSYGDCEKAVEYAVRLLKGGGVQLSVLGVLEEVYNLERGSVSFGMPVPPEVKEESKRRMEKRFKAFWEKYAGEEAPPVEYVVGPVGEEVKKFVKRQGYELVIWGCYPASLLCKVVDEIDASSLIIK